MGMRVGMPNSRLTALPGPREGSAVRRGVTCGRLTLKKRKTYGCNAVRRTEGQGWGL
jgi:hypothetical protein